MITLILAIIALWFLFLAAMVFYSNIHRMANVLFGLIALCFSLWSFGMVLFVDGHISQVVWFGAVLFYVGAALFAPLLLFFTINYHQKRTIKVRDWILTGIVTLPVLAMIIFDKNFIIIEPPIGNQSSVLVNHFGYLLFAIPFVIYFLAALLTYFRQQMKERKKDYLYIVGIIITCVPGFIFDLILPYFGNYSLIWIGPMVSLVFLGMTLYSMQRYRMLDIRSFLIKAITYFCLIIALAGIYCAAFYTLSLVFMPHLAHQQPVNSLALNIVVTLVAAFTFQPLRRLFDRYAERLFYRRNYDPQQVVDEATKITIRTANFDTMVEAYLTLMQRTFNARFIAVVFANTRRAPRAVGLSPDSAWLTLNEMKRLTARHSALLPYQIAAIFPLSVPAQEIGYMVIGRDRDERAFGRKDHALLTVLANELSIALINIFRLEEIRHFAGKLEHEVNDATAQLRRSNDQLRELDATKDEFVSMASHQLRTPLTSVKGYISMVIEGDAGKITNEQKKLLNEAFVSSERMVHLISDFLNVNRLQTGKFVIDRTATDLTKTVSEEVASMEQIADSHGVKIVYKAPSRFPLLYVDDDKIRQAIVNFIDNAVYYSPESKQVAVTLTIEDGDAVLRVIDHGMGVPRDEQHRLFTKFFRAQNARKQRPDGTGVGLFLAKKVVDGHGGRLVFHSIPGKGSTFGFRLPIKQLEIPPVDNEPSV